MKTKTIKVCSNCGVETCLMEQVIEMEKECENCGRMIKRNKNHFNYQLPNQCDKCADDFYENRDNSKVYATGYGERR